MWPTDAGATAPESEAPADGGEPDVPVAASAASAAPAAPAAPAATAGTPADGIRHLRTLLTSANIRRWPMYLRNVQQLLRQANPPLDVRAYGFGTLVDLLRAAHRDGVVRVDRDRQGVIRVFEMPGSTAPAASPTSVETMSEPLAPEETAAAADAETVRETDEPVEPAELASRDVEPAPTASAEPKKGRRRASTGRPARRRTKSRAD